MSNYSFSEEGSEAAADEDVIRDLDNLREVLEEDDLEGKNGFCVTSGLVARRAPKKWATHDFCKPTSCLSTFWPL